MSYVYFLKKIIKMKILSLDKDPFSSASFTDTLLYIFVPAILLKTLIWSGELEKNLVTGEM